MGMGIFPIPDVTHLSNQYLPVKMAYQFFNKYKSITNVDVPSSMHIQEDFGRSNGFHHSSIHVCQAI